MKIAHCIPALTKGGAERVVVELANHAAQEGHQVSIVAGVPTPPDQLPIALDPRISERFVAHREGHDTAVYRLLPAWMLRNRSWLLDHDVIHCHLTFGSVFGSALQIIRWLTRRGRPIVVETYHAVGAEIPKRNRAFHSALLNARDAVAFMALDQFWAAFRAGRPSHLIEHIPNGVSPPNPVSVADQRRYREVTGVPHGVRVVGSVGRLVRERRPDLLIHAFAELRRASRVDVHLLLAGEGPERPRLEALVRDLCIAEAVHMPGLTLNPAEPFSLIDVYVTVNVGEITGVAGLEAALAGLPIIAVQLINGRQAVPEDWIWSSDDPLEVGRRGAELIDDQSALTQLALTQRTHATSHFGVTPMAESYYRLYQQALARARTAGQSPGGTPGTRL